MGALRSGIWEHLCVDRTCDAFIQLTDETGPILYAYFIRHRKYSPVLYPSRFSENPEASGEGGRMVRLCAFDFSTVGLPLNTTAGSEVQGEKTSAQQHVA